MGFTTGLLSGLTLTTSTLYLTILLHRRNRLQQSALLADSTASLNSIIDPPLPTPPPFEHTQTAGVVEMAKDRWNRELRENVRKVSEVEWSEVGRDVESGIRGLWKALRKSLDDNGGS